MAPSASQAKTVHQQWNACDKDAFIHTMFVDMFAAQPEFRAKFGRFSGDPDPADSQWKPQMDITREGLEKALRTGDGDMAGLKSMLHDLAKKHVGFGVGQTEFQKFKPILAAVAAKKVPGIDTAAWQAMIDFILDNLV